MVAQKLVALAAAALLVGSDAFTPSRIASRTFSARLPAVRSTEEDVEEIDAEEAAVRAEAAVIAKRKRSNMFNENGVAYAPWMVNQIDEEAYVAAKELRKMRKNAQKAADASKEGAYFTTDLQADELSGLGLNYKLNGEEVELSWSTDTEPDNLGYKVQKRAARSEEWFTVASYEDWAPLNSKGKSGGTYTLIDPESETGDWIYRIVDVDRAGRNTVLCQALVEVQSQGEKVLSTVLAVGFAAIFGGFMAAGVLLDPIQ